MIGEARAIQQAGDIMLERAEEGSSTVYRTRSSGGSMAWTRDFLEAYREFERQADAAGWSLCGMCDRPHRGRGSLCASCSRIPF